MKKVHRTVAGRLVRPGAFIILGALLVTGTSFWGSSKVEANHPVFVEGNCDSPVPGTTLVAPGTCGDFDGDGRIGTAEDTDGADRIFGTLAAAIGPGTGAAAGTGANNNGTVLIVASGRFAEQVLIGTPTAGFTGGTANPGNVTIEAAPGVIASIDAVLQGDPAGGNTARQGGSGIVINYDSPIFAPNSVTLRNLDIRNFTTGVGVGGYSSVVVDNCRLEHNLGAGLRFSSTGKLVVTNSQFNNNGRRIGSGGSSIGAPGDGLSLASDIGGARVYNSTFSNNFAAGIRNEGTAAKLKIFKVATYLNGTDIVGPVTISADPNYSN